MWRFGFGGRSSRKQRKTALQQLREWDATTFDEILQGLDAYRGLVAEETTGFQINIHGEQRWPQMLDLGAAGLGELRLQGVGRPVIRIPHSAEACVKVSDLEGVEVHNLRFASIDGGNPDHLLALDNVTQCTFADLFETSGLVSSYSVHAVNSCDEVIVERCRLYDYIRGDFEQSCFINNRRLGGVYIDLGGDNRAIANHMTQNCRDTASSGNNVADGNTGGVSYAAWNATGSVAGDNT